jgi:hypothetical protein
MGGDASGQQQRWTAPISSEAGSPASDRIEERSMTAETPVLDTLADLTATSIEHNSLLWPTLKSRAKAMAGK